MRAFFFTAALAALLLVTGSARPVEAASLEVGSKAPPFELLGSDGVRYALSDHVGKRGVVLAWFPKAFTPG